MSVRAWNLSSASIRFAIAEQHSKQAVRQLRRA
jgi:hypothetical protein